MPKLCGGCDCVYPKEEHPHTDYHQCIKYKVRLFHLNYHPDLVCAPMCDKKIEVPMSVKLKPCPFCGMNMVKQLNGWYMHPGNYDCVCPIDGFRVDNDARSIDAWNRRTDVNTVSQSADKPQPPIDILTQPTDKPQPQYEVVKRCRTCLRANCHERYYYSKTECNHYL